MTRRLLAADALTESMVGSTHAGSATMKGDPQASSAHMADLGGLEIGLWEMTAGKVRDVEVDEVFLVLAGSGSVEFDDGEVVPLQPGALVRLKSGEHTTWTVEKTLRKLYISEEG